MKGRILTIVKDELKIKQRKPDIEERKLEVKEKEMDLAKKEIFVQQPATN
jgi:hypothetical protein